MAPRSDSPLAEAVDLDRALDEVFATPPEEFVKARDAVVKRLRAEKRRDEAAEVASLRRPTRLVWALNQLALTDDASLPALLDAVDDVRRGAGDQRAAVAALREAVGEAAKAAASALDPPRASDRADLGAALNAVIADADAVEALEAGRLVEVPTADPFGIGVAPAPTKPKAKAKAKTKEPAKGKKGKSKAKDAEPDPLAKRRAEKARREAEAVHAAAVEATAEAEEQVSQAEATLEATEQKIRAAEAAVAKVQEELAAAEAEREEATGAVEKATAAYDDARAVEEEAAAALERATADAQDD